MRGGIGAEGEVVLLGGIAEPVEHDARLHTREAPLRVELKQLLHVLGEVEDHRLVHRLAGQAGAAAARDDRCAVPAAQLERGLYVLGRARDHDAERHLPVARGVVCVKGTRAVREAHLAGQLAHQLEREGARIHALGGPRRVRVAIDRELHLIRRRRGLL